MHVYIYIYIYRERERNIYVWGWPNTVGNLIEHQYYQYQHQHQQLVLMSLVIRLTSKSASDRQCQTGASLRGWRNKVGNLIETKTLIGIRLETCVRQVALDRCFSERMFGSTKNYCGPQITGICVKSRGVRFHPTRDLKRYYFHSILPTSQYSIRSVFKVSCLFLRPRPWQFEI